jgi:hypothetical protein
MATLYAQGAGELSAVTWNTAANGTGSTETPTSADTLVSNSYTIDVDDTYTFVQVNNTGGGTFDLKDGAELTCTDEIGVLGAATGVGAVTFALTGTDSAILNANVLAGSISTSWGVSFTGTGTLTVNGEIRGGTFNGLIATTGAHGLRQTGAGTLIVDNGTGTALSGGTGNQALGVYGENVASIITVMGNVLGGTGSAAVGFYTTGSATITITGNLRAETAAALQNIGAATITITGDITGGSTAGAHGLLNTVAATITITGDLTGGSNTTANGLNNTGAATITITGDFTAQTAAALSNTNASAVIRARGECIPSLLNNAITSTTGTLLVTGPLRASANGTQALYARNWYWDTTATGSLLMEVYTEDITALRALYSADALPGVPAEADVKDGVTYGPSNELTGTYDATSPTPEAVAAAVWDHLLSDIETADSAGARLKELASTDAVGGIVAALGT